MMEYFYTYTLNGETIYYSSYILLENDNEILEWAAQGGILKEEDFECCSNIRLVPPEEVEEKNKALYKVWWEDRFKKVERGEPVGNIPPTIDYLVLY